MINEYILFYIPGKALFRARAVTESLPSGAAPCAILRDDAVLWTANFGSVSFPYYHEVDRAVKNFIDYGPENYLSWSMQEREVTDQEISAITLSALLQHCPYPQGYAYLVYTVDKDGPATPDSLVFVRDFFAYKEFLEGREVPFEGVVCTTVDLYLARSEAWEKFANDTSGPLWAGILPLLYYRDAAWRLLRGEGQNLFTMYPGVKPRNPQGDE